MKLCCTKKSKYSTTFYLNLKNFKLEQNIKHIKQGLNINLENKELEEIKTKMNAIKKMIKGKIPTKNKFYSLLLLNYILETKSNLAEIQTHFTNKFIRRFSLIANNLSKDKDFVKRAKTCMYK